MKKVDLKDQNFGCTLLHLQHPATLDYIILHTFRFSMFDKKALLPIIGLAINIRFVIIKPTRLIDIKSESVKY